MKDDDEFERLLGEIPHATSSLNLHHHHHRRRSDLDAGGHCHGHGCGHVYGIYDDELLKHKYTCISSPESGFSLQSDGSSSTLFSCGYSLSDIGSPALPRFEEIRAHSNSGDGYSLDFNKVNERNFVDGLSLSRNFSKMYISDEQDYSLVSPNGFPSHGQCGNEEVLMNFEKFGAYDSYRKGFSGYGGFNPSIPIRPTTNIEGGMNPVFVEMQHQQRITDLLGSQNLPSRPESMFPRSEFAISGQGPQSYRSSVLIRNPFPMGFAVSNSSSTLNRPFAGDAPLYPSQNDINLTESRNDVYLPNVVQLGRSIPQSNVENLINSQPLVSDGKNRVPLCVRAPHGSVEAFTNDDSLIIQGEGVNYGINRGYIRSRENIHKDFIHETCAEKGQGKRSDFDSHLHIAAIQDTRLNLKLCRPFQLPPKCNSLTEAQGYIYHIAKDQHGCRFLQRMFDEGNSRDVQIIFSEIIDHTVELMMNPFGNYLMQKLLEVCNEEQRMNILLRATEEPGELVRISLNTHGTRVVQKLIETLKTRQQILRVISNLEAGFLTLIKDLNGNHVIQRCLQCFTNEDSKFIFIAAAKYCVDIAMHQHGCCVLQRCIKISNGEHREKLVAEISANGLLLAQDPFGNYVVQFILELKIPSATSKLTSQFEGSYLHLSMQKFSSHVVEKCLELCNDETRSKIIQELLSANYFEQLLQDPHANYVVQKALRFSEGPLYKALVDAIEFHKVNSRNSPYTKRIFSHKLLRR
ncbi:pumilio7, chloroplastic [Dorcoceras hygrometricum]|uniref:Pumilio7, chloroplastic n=1 Tax=Dorcoceras hygrometricum TaxID=472368 RepID=A0A2Z7BKM8_9LAMI|nr:pumilio7, chloroplastic [Dorcoceras hygrometricum]